MAQTRKILVPNDFSVRPLILLKRILEQNEEDHFDITLLHGIYPPDSITDLLFYNKKKLMKEKETSHYLQACDLFKNKFYSRISSFQADIIASPRKHAMNDLLEVSGIEEVFIPEGIDMDFSGRQSFDVIALLKKADIKVQVVLFETKGYENESSAGDLTGLFLSDYNKSLVKKYEGSTTVS